MKSFSSKTCSEFRLRTSVRNELVDITSQVIRGIEEQQVQSGICVVFCPHTTGAITINENADPDVPRDMMMAMGRISPNLEEFRHGEGNSDSHVKTSLVGPSVTLIVEQGKPLLGMWQAVYFCEFDGPRERRFYVKTVRDVIE